MSLLARCRLEPAIDNDRPAVAERAIEDEPTDPGEIPRRRL